MFVFSDRKTSYISEKKLIEKLNLIENVSFSNKVDKVIFHYEMGSAKENRKFLKELRHSSLHRDNLYPSFELNLQLLDKLIVGKENWIEEISCTDFCQSIQNDMFYIVTHLSSVLYETKWKSG